MVWKCLEQRVSSQPHCFEVAFVDQTPLELVEREPLKAAQLVSAVLFQPLAFPKGCCMNPLQHAVLCLVVLGLDTIFLEVQADCQRRRQRYEGRGVGPLPLIHQVECSVNRICLRAPWQVPQPSTKQKQGWLSSGFQAAGPVLGRPCRGFDRN